MLFFFRVATTTTSTRLLLFRRFTLGFLIVLVLNGIVSPQDMVVWTLFLELSFPKPFISIFRSLVLSSNSSHKCKGFYRCTRTMFGSFVVCVHEYWKTTYTIKHTDVKDSHILVCQCVCVTLT